MTQKYIFALGELHPLNEYTLIKDRGQTYKAGDIVTILDLPMGFYYCLEEFVQDIFLDEHAKFVELRYLNKLFEAWFHGVGDGTEDNLFVGRLNLNEAICQSHNDKRNLILELKEIGEKKFLEKYDVL